MYRTVVGDAREWLVERENSWPAQTEPQMRERMTESIHLEHLKCFIVYMILNKNLKHVHWSNSSSCYIKLQDPHLLGCIWCSSVVMLSTCRTIPFQMLGIAARVTIYLLDLRLVASFVDNNNFSFAVTT